MSQQLPSLLAGIGDAMRYLDNRKDVIARNIANGDTPGFKAKETAPASFAGMVQNGAPGVAAPTVELSSTMVSLGARGVKAGNIVLDHDVTETKPDGNNVTLEDQLLKLGNIQQDFATLTNLYRKQMSLLKTALGKNEG
jgi:flagellar basal-body rod protein FlgB